MVSTSPIHQVPTEEISPGTGTQVGVSSRIVRGKGVLVRAPQRRKVLDGAIRLEAEIPGIGLARLSRRTVRLDSRAMIQRAPDQVADRIHRVILPPSPTIRVPLRARILHRRPLVKVAATRLAVEVNPLAVFHPLDLKPLNPSVTTPI